MARPSIPPDTEDLLAHGALRMNAAFTAIGDPSASTVAADSPHPLTVDGGTLISDGS